MKMPDMGEKGNLRIKVKEEVIWEWILLQMGE